RRDGGEYDAFLVPESTEQNGRTIGMAGMRLAVDPAAAANLALTLRYSPAEAFVQGAAKTWELSVFTLKMLGRILTGSASLKNISGPLTMADFAGQSARGAAPRPSGGIKPWFALLVVVLSARFAPASLAFEPFTVRDIRVEGVQRTDAGTVFNYLPIKVGDRVDDEKASAAVKALYATGFFRDVRLEVEGGVLVVIVQERPTISQIDIVGTKEFDK